MSEWLLQIHKTYMCMNKHRLQALYRQRHIPTHGAHMGSHKCAQTTTLEHGRSGSQVTQTQRGKLKWRRYWRVRKADLYKYRTGNTWVLLVCTWKLIIMSSVWSSLENRSHRLLVQSASDYRHCVYRSQPALPAFLCTDYRNQITALFILMLAITKLPSTGSLRLTAERITEPFCAQNWNSSFWLTKELELSTITYWKLFLRAF